MATEYLVQEEDGTSKITLEDGSGFILLEESSGGGAGTGGEFHRYYGVWLLALAVGLLL
jgi:hypothetical protein